MNHEVLSGAPRARLDGGRALGRGAATAAIRRVAAQDSGAAHVGATTACATYPHDGETLDELMRVADARLLASKRSRPAPAR